MVRTTGFAVGMTGVALAALTGASSAQDWTGFSVGIGGGYGFVNHELDLREGPLIAPFAKFNVNIDGLGGDGGLFTLSAGADYQLNPSLVIGAFIDYDFMSLETEANLSVNALGGLSARADLEVEDQLSIGGRLGYVATPSTLVFVTAGYSHVDVSDLRFSTDIFGSTLKGVLAGIGSLDGYFLGGGMETKLGRGFTLKAEYRYTDLTSEPITLLPAIAPAVNDFVRAEIAPTIQTARLSLNYRFGGRDGDATGEAPGVAGTAVWTGPYVGVGFGYGAANNEISFREGPLLPPGLFSANLDGVGHRGELFTIGLGYDFQVHSRFVIGALADFDLASIEHSDSVSLGLVALPGLGGPAIKARLDSEFENLVMIGGRLGYLVSPDTLVFGSLGYARADLSDTDFSVSLPFGSPLAGVLAEGREFSGYFIGGGIETALTSNISLKAEYRYIDLGSERIELLPDLFPAINDFVTTEFEPSLQTGRISLTYKFGGPREAAAPMK